MGLNASLERSGDFPWPRLFVSWFEKLFWHRAAFSAEWLIFCHQSRYAKDYGIAHIRYHSQRVGDIPRYVP